MGIIIFVYIDHYLISSLSQEHTVKDTSTDVDQLSNLVAIRTCLLMTLMALSLSVIPMGLLQMRNVQHWVSMSQCLLGGNVSQLSFTGKPYLFAVWVVEQIWQKYRQAAVDLCLTSNSALCSHHWE